MLRKPTSLFVARQSEEGGVSLTSDWQLPSMRSERHAEELHRMGIPAAFGDSCCRPLPERARTLHIYDSHPLIQDRTHR